MHKIKDVNNRLGSIPVSYESQHQVAGFKHKGKQDFAANTANDRIHFGGLNAAGLIDEFEIISVCAFDAASAIDLMLNRFSLSWF